MAGKDSWPLLRLGGWRFRAAATSRAKFHWRAVLPFVLTVDHHLLAGGQTAGDHRAVAFSELHLHRPDSRFAIRADDVDEGTLLPALNRRGRNVNRALAHAEKQPNVYKLVGPKLQVRAVELRFQPDRARGRVDCGVHHEQFSFGQFRLI